MANKIKYGIKSCYYAPVTATAADGTLTYDTPVALPGAVSISLSANGSSEPFYTGRELRTTATKATSNSHLSRTHSEKQFSVRLLIQRVSTLNAQTILRQSLRFSSSLKATRTRPGTASIVALQLVQKWPVRQKKTASLRRQRQSLSPLSDVSMTAL